MSRDRRGCSSPTAVRPRPSCRRVRCPCRFADARRGEAGRSWRRSGRIGFQCYYFSRSRDENARLRASLARCDDNPYPRSMGFHLVYGNDADALLDALAERLRSPHPAAPPLAPEIVLVPQFGLRRWLEIRLAEKLGIVANVEFAAPAEYAWRLLRAANPGLAPTSGYERE